MGRSGVAPAIPCCARGAMRTDGVACALATTGVLEFPAPAQALQTYTGALIQIDQTVEPTKVHRRVYGGLLSFAFRPQR